MLQAVSLGLLAGLLIGNGLPHFIKGIVHERHPTFFGSGPVVNLLGGWTALCLGALAFAAADITAQPWAGGAAVALGALLMGLFHAAGGVFGRD
ncbi:hypothetical protein [Glycomyces albidus]|uniref:Uncharacterized protein n=1 Tax=Glycomyces albidus TaxID=2656774 RepID=A0A6L5G3R6_9ACTN|nr:hypothetical protein [Glycomyces albidus]MQM24023.1 hypothetical protein [Glycomyces albidus]